MNCGNRLALRLAACLFAATAVTAQERAAGPAIQPGSAQSNVQVLPPLMIPGLDRPRAIRLYLPPDYEKSKARYPVLYMHDGQNLFDAATSFAGEWEVDETLNRLAQTKHLELIVVGIDNGGEHRMQEMTAWDNTRGKAEGEAYMAFVVDVVKPYIDARYRTKPDRTHTAIMGSSLGGLISHYAIHRYPQVFGMAGLFSPSYWYAPEVYAYTAAHPLPHDARLYFYCGGREDAHMLGNMRRMLERERASGLPAQQLEVAVDLGAKHSEAAWRKQFPRAVAWLFSGPQ
ncbi:MAG TPA: alpha/beta hydrolase-fold protein [Rudaea sp.]|jgi:predicted alpha/beta superfamily hydrolase